MSEACPPLTDREMRVAFSKGATDEEIEATLRNLFYWSYIVRDPLDHVCAVGKGTRADCIKNAFSHADACAIDVLSSLEGQDEIRALNGPWRFVLWPPYFDIDPPFWAASSNVFDES